MYEQPLLPATSNDEPPAHLLGTDSDIANEQMASISLEEQVGILQAQLDEKNQIIDELSAENEELYRLAYTDELTGLPNKRAFNKHLGELLEQAESGEVQDVALVIIDLDGFKAINDTRGHDFGDEFLKQVADFLKAKMREGDILCRWGGDELAVLISKLRRDGSDPEFTNEELLEQTTNRYRQTVELAAKSKDPHTAGSASVGGTLYEEGDTADTLMDRGDADMYKKKLNKEERLAKFK